MILKVTCGMLIYLVANLEWHSVNLQLNNVVLVIHVDVTDENRRRCITFSSQINLLL